MIYDVIIRITWEMWLNMCMELSRFGYFELNYGCIRDVLFFYDLLSYSSLLCVFIQHFIDFWRLALSSGIVKDHRHTINYYLVLLKFVIKTYGMYRLVLICLGFEILCINSHAKMAWSWCYVCENSVMF